MTHKIAFAQSVVEHPRWLTAAERKRVMDAIERHLAREPLVETRNRKPLRPNALAPWELRVGPLRVFYEVVSVEPEVVRVLAVCKKERRSLRIGEQEIVI